MFVEKKKPLAHAFLLLIFTFAAAILPPQAKAEGAEGNEYKSIVKHLTSRYGAKKVKIPMLWLARFAVKLARPAGVQSFSLTMFENLRFSRDSLDREMQNALKKSFGADWSPIFHIRSRAGEQVYMYMREEKGGKSVRITLVTIDKNQAAVIRATLNPDKLAAFVNNPKIFGISLGDDASPPNDKTAKPKTTTAADAIQDEKAKRKKPENNR